MFKFNKHVKKDLSAYCCGELSPENAQRTAQHLLDCKSCRREYDEIKLGIALAENLQRVSAPESLWSDMEALLDKQPFDAASTTRSARFAFPPWTARFSAVAASIILIVGISVFWLYRRLPETPLAEPSLPKLSWGVTSLEGAPKVGSQRIDEEGRLKVGEWLETDSASRAKIDIGEIGHVEIDPNTRIRLIEARSTEQRLSLERGSLHAMIFAPPRLFFVETPSAVAVDLGCAYTLEVDEAGSSVLHVTLGWVALELKNRESIVPAGALCKTRKAVGPGTPYFEDASQAFRRSLERIDFENNRSDALDVVLAESRERDSLTLWHLLQRLEEPQRERVYDKLSALVPSPKSVTKDGTMKLDRKMLDAWKSELEPIWMD